jgi:hypothetical protein
MTRPSIAAATGALLVTAVLLTACSDTRESGTDSVQTSPTSAAPSVPSPSPTGTPAAESVTCETLLDDSDEAKYAAAGWTLSTDYVERATAQQFPTVSFVTYGGVLCQIGLQGTDHGDVYAYSPITPAQAEAEKVRLTSEGYTTTSDLGGVLYEGHGDVDSGEEADLFYLFLDGSWYYTTVNRDALEKAVRNVEAL